MKTKAVIVNKRTLSFALLSLLLLVACIQTASAHNAPFPGGYNSTSFVIDTTGNPISLDPAYAYDTRSSEVTQNVYETLIFFDPMWSLGPYQPPPPAPQRSESFVPQIAYALPTIDHTLGTNPKSGLPVYTRFTFPIMTGVEFHHGPFSDPDGSGPLMGSTGILTPRDVEYSIERVMVQDSTGGPSWLLYEPLLGVHRAKTPAEDPDWGIKIDGAVEVSGNNVVFYLAGQYPDLAFEQILCGTWASVLSEAWAANEGDLNMNMVTPLPGETNKWTNWEYIYNTWHAPRPSYLEDAVDKADPMKDGGTGPYRYAYWTRGTAWSITRYAGYREGWPAPIRKPVEGPKDRLGGYLDSITWFLVVNWPTRLAALLAGSRDMVTVPRSYRDQVLGQVVGGEPIRSYYPFTQLSASALFFTMDISPTAVPGYVPVLLAPGTFSGAGVPPNIFGIDTVTDQDEGMNVRKAFAHAWDYGYAISAGYLDEATQPASPIIDGLAFQNPAQTKPDYSLTKAEYYFKLAWGGLDDRAGGVYSKPVLPEDPAHISVTGALWNGGMRMTTVWPTGEVAYMLAQQKMNAEINLMNPNFHLTDKDVDWGTIFLPDMNEHKLPVFNMEWPADFADPHSMVHPFMHSQGTFGASQVISITVTANGLRQVFVDDLIEQGIVTPDTGTTTKPAGTAIIDWFDDDQSGTLNTGDWAQIGESPSAWYERQADDSYKYDRQMIYYELQDVYVKYTPSTMVFQSIGRGFEQAWVRGWYDNKLFSGNYWYHQWKAKTHFGDCDWSGTVDVNDRATISAHWTGAPVPGPGGFNPRADINGGTGAYTDGLNGPLRGIPDGQVDMMDLCLLMNYWDVPSGPLHPGGGYMEPSPLITVSVSPQRNIKLVGETFSVDITVSAVQILWGYQFVVRYDTAILTATDCTNLAYLVDPQFTLGGSTINEDEGYVYASFYHSLSGSGFTTTETRPLLSITFTVDASGTSPIDIDEDESGLVDAGARAWINPYNLNVNDGTVAPPNADINGDGKVNIVDIALVSAHWYPGPPIGPLGYDPIADINGDGAINMLEISSISAYWTGPPKGPLDP